jgi:hypothetical protein
MGESRNVFVKVKQEHGRWATDFGTGYITEPSSVTAVHKLFDSVAGAREGTL